MSVQSISSAAKGALSEGKHRCDERVLYVNLASMRKINTILMILLAVLVTAGSRQCSTEDTGETGQKQKVSKGPVSAGIERLAEKIRRLTKEEFAQNVEMRPAWSALELIGWRSAGSGKCLKLAFYSKDVSEPFESYCLVPWQPLYAVPRKPERFVLDAPLLTVTADAMVFGPLGGKAADNTPRVILKKVSDLVAAAVDRDGCEKELKEKPAKAVPSNLQIIKAVNHPYYIEVEIALPGSGHPMDRDISKMAPDKMIRVSIVPDRGEVIQRWLAPSE